MEYLTDIVKEDYEIWQNSSSLIFLFSQTGSGKTTLSLAKVALSFIKREKNNDNENESEEEKERKKNKIILYLVPRTILKEQIENDKRLIFEEESINKTPKYNLTFHIWTYHHLEGLLLDNKEIPLFDLIICDEIHYFMADSLFNAYTQLSYDYIFYVAKSPRLLLTATPDDIMHYMTENISFEPILPDIWYSITMDEWDAIRYDINDIFYEPTPNDRKRSFNLHGLDSYVSAHTAHIYRLPKNYDYINTKYLTDDDEVIDIIRNTQEKTIVFVSSKQRGETLQKNLKECKIDSAFITADNKNTDAKKTIDELAKNRKFSEKVLITTSVLDVGVSIEDNDVDNIIIATTEPMEFLQMLGRVRLTDNTKKRINLFIFKRSYKYFQKLRDSVLEKIKCCEYLEEYEEYNKNHYLQGILEKELHPKNKNDLPKGYKNFLYLKNNLGFGNKKVPALNKLAPYYLRRLHLLYDDICKKIQKDDNYFIKKQLEWLGRENDFSDVNFYSLELEKRNIQILQNAIKNKAKEIKSGISLKKRTEILAFFQPLVRNVDNKFVKSNVSLSMNKFNEFCNKHSIPYKFISKTDKSTRKEVYYLTEIIEIDD